MQISMPEISREKRIVLGLAMVIFFSIGLGHYFFKELPAAPQLIIIPSLLNLAGRGDLPPLALAVEQDQQLQGLIKQLSAIPATDVFTRRKDVDALVATILFRWANADMAQKGAYGPNIDERVASFLKRIGSFSAPSGTQVDIKQAAALEQLWAKVFAHYRIPLLAQTAARPVYNGKTTYDPNTDAITVNGAISETFIRDFQIELQNSANSAETMRALLDFIDVTKGFDRLSDEEQDLVMSLTPPKKQALQPLPQISE